MPLRVSGKNISVGPALRERISERVEQATLKYFRGGYSGHATVGKDGFGSELNACCIWIPARCSKRKAWPPTRMTARISLRPISKNGCVVTNAVEKATKPSAAAENTGGFGGKGYSPAIDG